MPLIDGMKKVHNLDIQELKDPKQLVKDVYECIENNSKAWKENTKEWLIYGLYEWLKIDCMCELYVGE